MGRPPRTVAADARRDLGLPPAAHASHLRVGASAPAVNGVSSQLRAVGRRAIFEWVFSLPDRAGRRRSPPAELEFEGVRDHPRRDHTRDAREAEHCSSRGFVGGQAACGASLRVGCPRAQVPGRGLGDEDGAARRRKEERSLEALRRGAVSSVRDLEALHRFLFVEHGAYRAMSEAEEAARERERATGALARTY